MATYPSIDALIEHIETYIVENGEQSITGPVLQDVLDSMVQTLDSLKVDSTAFADETNARELADERLADAIATKQNIIADLATIRTGAAAGATAYQKPAGGIPEADLAEAVRRSLSLANTSIQTLAPVTDLIPAAASVNNQLADKAFVNSSISTNTAYYISDDGQPFASLQDLENYSGPLTNNDYAFVVGEDEDGNTIYTRYKYNANTQTWGAEYVLNNSSFTAVQWASINSGITAELVTVFSGKYSKPANGIPATDMAQAVQDALALAASAVQPAALAAYEQTANKVTAIGNDATDTQYPSALAVKNALAGKMSLTPINVFAQAPALGEIELDADSYNRIDFEVNSLDIELPEITDLTHVHSVIISLTTGANPAIGWIADSFAFFDGYSIEPNTSYEFNCLFNGTKWIIAHAVVE